MLNPFGEDDDDFEINVLIDRHIKVNNAVCSFALVFSLSSSFIPKRFGSPGIK